VIAKSSGDFVNDPIGIGGKKNMHGGKAISVGG